MPGPGVIEAILRARHKEKEKKMLETYGAYKETPVETEEQRISLKVRSVIAATISQADNRALAQALAASHPTIQTRVAEFCARFAEALAEQAVDSVDDRNVAAWEWADEVRGAGRYADFPA